MSWNHAGTKVGSNGRSRVPARGFFAWEAKVTTTHPSHCPARAACPCASPSCGPAGTSRAHPWATNLVVARLNHRPRLQASSGSRRTGSTSDASLRYSARPVDRSAAGQGNPPRRRGKRQRRYIGGGVITNSGGRATVRYSNRYTSCASNTGTLPSRSAHARAEPLWLGRPGEALVVVAAGTAPESVSGRGGLVDIARERTVGGDRRPRRSDIG